MDERDTKILSFEVSAEEAQSVNTAAREAGLSRSEYLRQRLASPAEQSASAGASQPSKDTTVLLQHVLYGLHCVHAAIYAMAETTGALSPAQADRILQGSMQASHDFLAHLDERITTVRQQVKFAEPELEMKKPVQEIKGDGLARSV